MKIINFTVNVIKICKVRSEAKHVKGERERIPFSFCLCLMHLMQKTWKCDHRKLSKFVNSTLLPKRDRKPVLKGRIDGSSSCKQDTTTHRRKLNSLYPHVITSFHLDWCCWLSVFCSFVCVCLCEGGGRGQMLLFKGYYFKQKSSIYKIISLSLLIIVVNILLLLSLLLIADGYIQSNIQNNVFS